MDKVAEVFRTYHRRDPRHGEHDTDTSEQLKLLYRGYGKNDPAIKQQKALTPSFFKFMYKNAITPRQQAIALLCIGAFFWACRSCKYSTVKGERHTKICKLRNIRFFIGNRELHHNDTDLANADKVTWTFEDQKNLEKDVTIPHDNNNEPVMNPVRALATTVKRIRSYPGTNENTNICTYLHSNKLIQFSQDDIL